MRVLLAIDGSPQATKACDLVGSLRWPDETAILALGVVEPWSVVLTGLSSYGVPDADRDAIVGLLDAQLTAAAASLEAPGRVVERRRVEGRPGTVIVEQAADFHADLVVVGSRGLGPLRSMLLGSVSAEVVDHAPCPVLVVRAPAIQSVLLAVDGSSSAITALEHLCAAHYLAGRRVEVLTVGPPVSSAAAFRVPRIADEHRRAEAQAEAAVRDLVGTGWDARSLVAAGNPAHEIIRAAADLGCDLIVMGSRGHTGLDRIRLGSVARNVLLHTHASVLIVREQIQWLPSDPAETTAGAVELLSW